MHLVGLKSLGSDSLYTILRLVHLYLSNNWNRSKWWKMKIANRKCKSKTKIENRHSKSEISKIENRKSKTIWDFFIYSLNIWARSSTNLFKPKYGGSKLFPLLSSCYPQVLRVYSHSNPGDLKWRRYTFPFNLFFLGGGGIPKFIFNTKI